MKGNTSVMLSNPPISIQNSNARFTTVAMKPLKYMIKDMENIVLFLNQTVFISVDFTLAEKPKMKIKNLNKQQYMLSSSCCIRKSF